MADENNLNESVDSIRQATNEISQNMKFVAEQMGILAGAMGKTNQSANQNTAAVNKNSAAIEGNTKLSEIEKQARQKNAEAMENYSQALKSAQGAVKGFASALLDTTSGFQKYEGAIKSTTSAIGGVLSNFGPLGKALGFTVEALGKLSGAVLKQTDAMVKAYDDLAEIGGAASMNAEQIMELGKQAGFTSHNIGIFTKHAKEAGTSLIGLGGSASEGIKTFSKFTAVGDETLKQYRRLGMSQEQLMEAQATYIRQQTEAGQSLRKSPEQLQKASLAYIDQLNVLSELTGVSVKKQQEALDIANANENFNAYKFAMDQKALGLEEQARNETDAARKKELEAQAAQIRQTVAAKDEFAKMAVSTMSAANAAAVMESISTEGATVYTENNAKLARAGIDVAAMNEKLNKGQNQTAQLLGSQAQAAERFTKTFGEAGYALGQSSKDIQGVFGVDNKMRQSAAQFAQLKTKEEQDAWIKSKAAKEEELKAKKEEGQEGQGVVDATATKEDLERQARRLSDAFIGAINPFRGNILAAGAAVVGMTAAVVAATMALSKLATAAGMGGLLDKVGGGDGKGKGKGKGTPRARDPKTGRFVKGGAEAAKSAGTLAKLATPLASVAKAAPAIGAVVGVGMAAKGAYDEYQDIEAQRKSGEITEKEAKEKKTEAVGGGVGSAAGAAGGAWAGAAAGAALGSAVPVVGTIIGGVIGAAVGGWLGSKGGETVGKAAASGINQMSEKADAKTAEAAKKVEAKADQKPAEVKKPESAEAKPIPVAEKKPDPVVESAGILASLGRGAKGLLDKVTGVIIPSAQAKTPTIEPKSPEVKEAVKVEPKLTPAEQAEKANPQGLRSNAMAFGQEKDVKSTGPKEQPSMIPGMIAATAASPEARLAEVQKGAEERIAKIMTPDKNMSEMMKQFGISSKSIQDQMKKPVTGDEKVKTSQDIFDEMQKNIFKASTSVEDLGKSQQETGKTVNDSLRQFQQMLDISNKSLANLTINFTKFDSVIKGTLDEVSPEDATKEVKDQIKGVLGSALLDIGKIKSQLKDASAAGAVAQAPVSGGVVSGDGKPITSSDGKPIMSGMPPSMPSAPPPMKQDVKENLGGIAEALKKRGMTDQNYINAVLGNVMKESGGKVTNENLNYSKTSNERIRSIFKSATAGKTDEEINEMKSSPEKMAEAVYGSGTKLGKGMGNSEPGDGWKFRGRGYIQLTGKNNYAAASKAIFGDDRLVENPDLVNDPNVASEVVAWYMQKGQSSMAGKLGIDSKGGMSAEQAQLLATSQIAGTAIKPGQGYLGGEVLQKVAMYSSKMPGGQQAGGERVMQASGGLIADGPETGYPVQHHGLEITAPLDTESILMKLAKTQAGSPESKDVLAEATGSKMETGSDVTKEMLAANMEMYSMMAGKLDQVIAQLSDGNDTSSKLLKHSLI
jgi:predicted chitinase